MCRETTLTEILQAREVRVREQEWLRTRYCTPVISFTMNIAGPVKDSPLIRRGFHAGQSELEAGLQAGGLAVLCRREKLASTGCEAVYAVAGTAKELKALCISIEDSAPLGRLFDMDVITPDGHKLERPDTSSRRCIVCGAPGRDCAARRVHPVESLQTATQDILTAHFASADRAHAAALVTRALLDEVCTTPKPGLVDRANNGSHRDMDIFTFTASAAALAPYWAKCMQIGQETAKAAPSNTFQYLRPAGQAAERTMFSATGGINTHKGAIFTLGTICGAVGRLWRADLPCRDPEAILLECGAMAASAVSTDFAALTAEDTRTAGGRLYLTRGITGIRGEAARGFPSVRTVALPALRKALAAGQTQNNAAVTALLALIAAVDDTNMIARGGPEAARQAAKQCAGLLNRSPLPTPEEAALIDLDFIQRNLSPGGCADLLAAALFLLTWENEGRLQTMPEDLQQSSKDAKVPWTT